MIISTVFNLFLISIIAGYSFFFKNILIKRDNKVSNLDLLYGIILLILLSTVLNFFFPSKIFFLYNYFFWIYFFFIWPKEKKNKNKFYISLINSLFFNFYSL